MGAADVSVRSRVTGRTSTGTVPVEGRRNPVARQVVKGRTPPGWKDPAEAKSRKQVSSGSRVATEIRGPWFLLGA